jgi:hypothetical protein
MSLSCPGYIFTWFFIVFAEEWLASKLKLAMTASSFGDLIIFQWTLCKILN